MLNDSVAGTVHLPLSFHKGVAISFIFLLLKQSSCIFFFFSFARSHFFSLTCCILLIQHPITVTIILQFFFPVKDRGRSCRASGALAAPLCVRIQNSPFFLFPSFPFGCIDACHFSLSSTCHALTRTSSCHPRILHCFLFCIHFCVGAHGSRRARQAHVTSRSRRPSTDR